MNSKDDYEKSKRVLEGIKFRSHIDETTANHDPAATGKTPTMHCRSILDGL